MGRKAKPKKSRKASKVYSSNNTGTDGVTHRYYERWSKWKGKTIGPYITDFYRAVWSKNGKSYERCFAVGKQRTDAEAFKLAVEARQKGLRSK